MSFIVILILFAGACGWLDARWIKAEERRPANRAN